MKPQLRALLRPAAAFALAAAPVAPAAAQLPAPPASAPGPLSAGGYASLTLRRAQGDSAGTEIDLNEAAAALLLSGTPWQRLSYFAEIEAASVSRETFTGREEERWLEVERAYVEWSASDALRLRLGRFLTPVGQWNEIHAAPLTWTAARPLTTYRAFAKSTTGAMLAGQVALGPRDAGYALWASPFGVDPRGEGEESAFLRAAGGRVAFELLPGLYLGASAAGFRASRALGDPEPEEEEEEEEENRLSTLRPSVLHPAATHEPGHREDPEDPEDPDDDDREEDREARVLLGADVAWRIGGLHLLAEATRLSASEDEPAETGAFVQTALPLVRNVHLTGRVEVYDPVVSGRLSIYGAGLAWRPTPRLTLKVERQGTDRPSRRVANGWLVSLSGLF
ncbi:MAG TPA: hypothetical protein VFR37_10615 [Longimicrobium sp.]|nr:hypothetical protein [Longimicrobium sp.]